MKIHRNNYAAGFTLIEVLVTLGLMILGVLAITQLSQLYLFLLQSEKHRVTAISLANQKIEIIRNLSYSDIGTAGGIPPGNLIQNETITRNNIPFTVTTEVVYIDDPFDGLISTTGSEGSIYNTANDEVLYYWDFGSNSDGTSPVIGNGTLSFDGTTLETGYQGNGIGMTDGDKITTTATGNIDLSQGRIGIWYKPDLANAGTERLLDFETDSGYLFIRRESNEKLQFSFGGESVQSENLTWNSGQWYFIEAAWEGNNYRQIWRDGVPLGLRETSSSAPVLDNQMNIGNRGDSSQIVEGVLDELYILNNAHKYEIWGYNQSNPYVASSPITTFYWNMDSTTSPQTPQVGSGTITLGGDYEALDPAVKNAGLYLSNDGSPDTDHAYIPATDNISFSEARISFWFKPRNNNNVNNNNDYLLKANGCSSGLLELIRTDDEKLEFSFGSASNNITIESQDYPWDKDYWYFIEVAYDDAVDTAHVYINRQEVAVSTTTAFDAPIGCTGLYFANENSGSSKNGDGYFDEMYILSKAYPESEAATDLLNTDYKRAKVTVTWEDKTGPRSVYLITDIAPPGIETTAGGGTLILNVFDANAQLVENASVHILNTSLDPIVDLTLTTDADGKLILPGAPATSTSYQVAVTKTGYSTDQTISSTGIYTTPVRDHLSVIENETTEVSFSIDQLSSLTINTVSQSLPVNWKINTDTVSTTNQLAPALTNSDTDIFFAWQDYRGGSTSDIYSQRYTTNGTAQWASDTNILTTQNHTAPRVALDASQNLYTTWFDDTNGNYDIYATKQNSTGADAWSGANLVNSDAGSATQQYPDITELNGTVYIVWEDLRSDGGDIYLNALSSVGTKQFGSDVKINTDSGTAVQSRPRIQAGTDGNLYISWIDTRNGQQDVYVHKIDTSGSAVWASEVRATSALTGTIDSFDMSLDSGDATHIAWSDNRNGDFDLFWQRVASSTAILEFASDSPLTTQAPNSNQQAAKISVDQENNIFFAWQDARSSSEDVYILKTDTSGASLWPQEIKINLITEADQLLHDIGIYQTNRVIATWTDYSDVGTDVWVGTLNYDGTEAPVPFVDFDMVGAKLTHQSPDKAKYEQSLTTDAFGQLLLTDLEWDSYSITVTDSLYSLTQSSPTLPLTVDPATNTVLKLIVD